MAPTSAWRKWRPFVWLAFCFVALTFLLDGCMQFRMNRSEIEKFFEDKPYKGTLHQIHEGTRVINYLKAGNDQLPLVVFVHGSPGSLSAFINFMADTALLQRAQLISVDRPGFGSSNFGYAEPSLKKQASLLKPILEAHKGNRPLILVGHSLGGPVIARMAMEFPELVDALVMVAPSIDPDLEPYEWFRYPLATPFLSWMLPRSIRASNDEIYKLKPELQEMLPLWSTITTRTIVIQGGKDDLVPPGNADFARKMMTQADVTIWLKQDINHFIPWVHPELIRDAVLECLNHRNRGTHP